MAATPPQQVEQLESVLSHDETDCASQSSGHEAEKKPVKIPDDSADSSKSAEPRIAKLLRKAAEASDTAEIVALLTLCDDIYYSTKPHTYKRAVYTVEDLPSDDIYRAYRKKYTPDVDTASLFVRGAKNVRGEELILHDYPMGSLSKFEASNIAKLQTIFVRMGGEADSIAITLKIDGVSMQTHYIGGKLIKAVTRYDHKTGRSVIEVAQKFATRPDPSFEGKIVINGEVILRGSNYKALGFSHPRNGAAGILNRKSISDAGSLDYIIFDLIAYEPTAADVKNGWPAEKPKLVSEQFELLKRLGYEHAPLKLVGRDALTEERLNAILNEMRATTNVPSDGLVVCPNTWTFEKIDPPKMKVAYKGPSSGDWTTVIVIEPRATRTGNVIPQVYVEPVHVGGIVINSIAGANYSILQEKKICVGSRVLVVKAKEVIPFIEAVDNEQLDLVCVVPPTNCPACETAVVAKDRMLTCPNPQCPAKAFGKIEVFLDSIGMKGVGKKRLEILEVDSIHELYAMSVTDMMQFPGIGQKTAQTIYDQLRSCITPIPEAALLAAIGPPLIRGKTAELIVKHVHIDELFGDTPFPLTKLQQIKGIGPEKSTSLFNFHREGANLLRLLKQHGLVITKAADATVTAAAAASSAGTGTGTGTGAGEVVCMTGKGSKTRTEYEQLIARKGWTNVTAVSGRVTLVVTDDPDSTTTKMETAKKLGKRIITYIEFDRMLAS